MNDEFKTFAPAPELTLEPFKEEMQTPVPAPEKQEIMDESILTDDERRETYSRSIRKPDRSDQFHDDSSVWCRNPEKDGGFF